MPVVRTPFALAPRFFAFCSPAPVQKCRRPSNHIAGSGVTWGRPSPRTVDNQNISAASNTSTTSGQGRAVASGSLNSSTSSTVGSVVMTPRFVAVRRHRP